VEPTPLAASEIVRILKVDFVWSAIMIYRAAQLTRNSFGGTS
jgi:hypothetical protein